MNHVVNIVEDVSLLGSSISNLSVIRVELILQGRRTGVWYVLEIDIGNKDFSSTRYIGAMNVE